MPSIGYPIYSTCAHLTAKHRSIIELSITGTSCDPDPERLLLNLVWSMRSPA
jgi:hypothetical protein